MKSENEERQKLRKELLEGMCRCAEEINMYFMYGCALSGVKFIDGYVPEAFKPGVADKFLFNKIIDYVIEGIEKDGKDETNHDIMGVSIMAKYYYPRYGTYKKMTRSDREEYWREEINRVRKYRRKK